mmetsp:Transcript_15576/g.35641  ORF Transcript_15576/g.35641 Transcript_15576/m.35641 type:complete len:105 (-) Transcript_15576:171-485(-)
MKHMAKSMFAPSPRDSLHLFAASSTVSIKLPNPSETDDDHFIDPLPLASADMAMAPSMFLCCLLKTHDDCARREVTCALFSLIGVLLGIKPLCGRTEGKANPNR